MSDLQEGEAESAGLGRGPAQGHAVPAVRNEQRAVARHPDGDLFTPAAFDADKLALQPRLLRLSLVEIAPGALIELLQVEVLHIEPEVGNPPGD